MNLQQQHQEHILRRARMGCPINVPVVVILQVVELPPPPAPTSGAYVPLAPLPVSVISDADLAASVERFRLAEGTLPPLPSPPPKVVIEEVCRHFGVSVADFLGPRRYTCLSHARQVATYMLRTLLKKSFPDIGRRLGGRDHTTAIHGFRKVAAGLLTTPALADDIETIRLRIMRRVAIHEGVFSDLETAQ